jgi:ubiquinone/menaquinone biosynthesis C-methylase UbiE
VSQFARMFFTDAPAALAEMARVTTHDGRVALVVSGQPRRRKP